MCTEIDTMASAFAAEADVEKRIDMIEDLVAHGVSKDASLAVLVLAADARQSRAVRVAAIDALSEIEDPRALTLLHVMKGDPDMEIRKLAAEALVEFEDYADDGD